jgi:hypothetical protein
MNPKLLIGIVAMALGASQPLHCAELENHGEAVMTRPLDSCAATAMKAAGQGEGRISFQFRNGGSSAVKVMQDYLPWNTTCSLKLVAVPLAKGMAAVEAVLPIEDPRATVLEIPANGELHGELDVSHFFPRWQELTKKGMLLLWSFNLYDTETGHAKRFSGVIEYPAK